MPTWVFRIVSLSQLDELGSRSRVNTALAIGPGGDDVAHRPVMEAFDLGGEQRVVRCRRLGRPASDSSSEAVSSVGDPVVAPVSHPLRIVLVAWWNGAATGPASRPPSACPRRRVRAAARCRPGSGGPTRRRTPRPARSQAGRGTTAARKVDEFIGAATSRSSRTAGGAIHASGNRPYATDQPDQTHRAHRS
jgi:hypothetical protein